MVENHESAQIALFLNTPQGRNALQVWGTMFDTQPTAFQTIAPGHTVAQGELHDMQLQIQAHTSRIDLIVQGSQVPGGPIALTKIPSFETGIAALIDEARKIVPDLSVGRSATVLQGITPADSRNAAAINASRLAPNVPMPDGSIDFYYQVVVPRHSEIQALRKIQQMFRITTVQMQFVNIVSSQAASNVAQMHAAHLYVDVYGELMEPLNTDQALMSIKETSDIALNIAREGYNAIG